MSYYPGFALANQTKYLWLNVLPYKVNSLSHQNRDITWDVVPLNGDEMSFAIVDGWDERIAHTWDKFDSITSKILEKFVTIGAAANSAVGIATGRETAYAAKVDEALIYKDSPRRAFTFTLNLAAYRNPQTEVVEPVKKLQKYSCASTGQGAVKLKWPYIFGVSVSATGSDPLLKMDKAALTNVDVTWKMPFMTSGGGSALPGVATLVVTFIEMDPLYQNVFV